MTRRKFVPGTARDEASSRAREQQTQVNQGLQDQIDVVDNDVQVLYGDINRELEEFIKDSIDNDASLWEQLRGAKNTKRVLEDIKRYIAGAVSDDSSPAPEPSVEPTAATPAEDGTAQAPTEPAPEPAPATESTTVQSDPAPAGDDEQPAPGMHARQSGWDRFKEQMKSYWSTVIAPPPKRKPSASARNDSN